MKENWTPQSWKTKKALHQPNYQDISKLKKHVINPDFVFSDPIEYVESL